MNAMTMTDTDFNPCCFGSVSATRSRTGCSVIAIRDFNPCCFGSVSATLLLHGRRLFTWIFQSLLFWIGLCDFRRSSTGNANHSYFNPCCFGSVSATTLKRHALQKAKGISILAVLDRSLRPYILCKTSYYSVISILAVLDRSLRPGGSCEADQGRRRDFNPCCFGSVSATPKYT